MFAVFSVSGSKVTRLISLGLFLSEQKSLLIQVVIVQVFCLRTNCAQTFKSSLLLKIMGARAATNKEVKHFSLLQLPHRYILGTKIRTKVFIWDRISINVLTNISLQDLNKKMDWDKNFGVKEKENHGRRHPQDDVCTSKSSYTSSPKILLTTFSQF